MEQNYPTRVGWKSPKVILGLIAMLLITGIVVVSIIRDRIVNVQQWQVSVTGQGKITYQPDIATISLGVQVDKISQADAALKQLNDKMDAVVAAIKKAGVADEDIKTQNYSIYPQYDYINNASTLAGYNANQQLAVKVRDLKDEAVSKIITAATKAGANQVNGITFDVANLEQLKQQARILAITDAKSKAGALAAAADVKLKRIVGWWENFIQTPGQPVTYYDGKGGMGAGGAVSSGTVPSGSQEIIVEVNLSYQIK